MRSAPGISPARIKALHGVEPVQGALTHNRWWVYQRERFPLAAHAPLVAAFSFCAVVYSAALRGEPGLPAPGTFFVAFVGALLFFLQLRIADEFKDHEEDCRYRPYRPVPRGLIRLRELAVLGVASAVAQLLLALWLHPPLVLVLLLVWGYLALMSHEFFVRDWLKARPVTYLWSHMLIMPLIDLYATACDWLSAGEGMGALPDGLIWFLLASFCNGVVIELGRKIRASADEETGVETYSALWGPRRALVLWLGAIGATAFFASLAAARIDILAPVLLLLLGVFAVAAFAAFRFMRAMSPGAGKRFEWISGVWTLVMYLGLGGGSLIWTM